MHPAPILITLFLVQILSLYFFSRQLTKYLSHLLYRITHSHIWTVRLIALTFLPGTLIHELSHAIVAGMLFVDSGEINLWPKIHESGVKLGSVEIYQTDALRRAIIGVAPVLVGISLIVGTLLILVNFYQSGGSFPVWALLIYSYILFIVGNTMFSSRKDLEGSLEIIIAAVLAMIGSYVLAKYNISGLDEIIFTPLVTDFIIKSCLSIAILIVADLLLIGLLKLVLHRR